MSELIKPARLAGLVVILIALSLYLSTLDNGLRLSELKGGDPITHQYAEVQGRPSNAPGYPLYTMGGWLWFHAGRVVLSPLFNPTEILSLYSTLWGLASLLVLYALIRELTRDNWPIAALGTLFYAFTYFFWYYSISSEQLTSAVFQTLLMVLWAFRWERTRRDRYLYLLALSVGVALAHMITVLFIAPPLLVFILTAEPRILTRFKLISRSFGLVLLPLISYVYVYLGGALHPAWRGAGEWHSAWQWFLSFISTQQGRDEMTWKVGPLTAEFPGLIFWDLSLIGVILALLGWWWLGRRKGGFLFASLAIYVGFSYIDRFGNWYQVIMPMYPLLVVGIAVVGDRLWRWADTRQRPGVWRAAVLVGLGVLVASRLIDPDPRIFLHNRPDDDGLRPALALLADAPEHGATIIGDGDQFVSLEYLTEVWGERPDVHAARLSEASSLLERGAQPLYATPETLPLILHDIQKPLHLSSHGAQLIALNLEPVRALPAGVSPRDVAFGDSLRLVGFRVEDQPAQGEVQCSLFWQTQARLKEDWSVSVRPTLNGELLHHEGGAVIQVDAQHPVSGFYPTSRWTPGEVVRDDYEIPVAPDRRFDGVQIVVYRALDQGFENLGVANLAP